MKTPSQAPPIQNGLKIAPRFTQQAGMDNPVWVQNPDDARFKVAMRKKCEVCGAKPNRPCWNTIDDAAPLPNRLVHYGRLQTL